MNTKHVQTYRKMFLSSKLTEILHRICNIQIIIQFAPKATKHMYPTKRQIYWCRRIAALSASVTVIAFTTVECVYITHKRTGCCNSLIARWSYCTTNHSDISLVWRVQVKCSTRNHTRVLNSFDCPAHSKCFCFCNCECKLFLYCFRSVFLKRIM